MLRERCSVAWKTVAQVVIRHAEHCWTGERAWCSTPLSLMCRCADEAMSRINSVDLDDSPFDVLLVDERQASGLERIQGLT
jgi:hypothetical protein